VVVEPKLAGLAVNLDEFLPVVRLFIGLVMFNQFELIGEPASDEEFVNPIGIVTTDFFCDQPLVVFVKCDALHYSVNLGAFREKVHPAFLVEHSLDTLGYLKVVLVFVNEKLGAPRGRHVEHFFFVLNFLVLVTGASVFAFTVFFGFVLFYHDVLPFTSDILLEVKVDSFDFPVWLQINPEVLVVEYGLDREVRAAVKLVFAASSRFNKNGFWHLTGACQNHDPCVNSAPAILIFAFVIGFIIVN
jgi:hypothetical protein